MYSFERVTVYIEYLDEKTSLAKDCAIWRPLSSDFVGYTDWLLLQESRNSLADSQSTRSKLMTDVISLVD